jgi:hypothetical protein
MSEKWMVNLACDSDFHVNHRVLLHAANLRHGTDGFTSLPKEGMLWILSLEKSDSFGMLTARPPKPLYADSHVANAKFCLCMTQQFILLCVCRSAS